MVRPSLLMPPFSSVGTSAARIGTSRPSGSVAMSGSKISTCATVSTCCVERIGFSVLMLPGSAIRSVPGTVQECRPPLLPAPPASFVPTRVQAASSAHASAGAIQANRGNTKPAFLGRTSAAHPVELVVGAHVHEAGHAVRETEECGDSGGVPRVVVAEACAAQRFEVGLCRVEARLVDARRER